MNLPGSEGMKLQGYDSAQIPEAGVEALRGLIGSQPYRVYAPCLQVAGPHLTAPSFSIPVSGEKAGEWTHKYVVIRCEWSETPRTLTDFWRILVSFEDKPNGIGVDLTGAVIAPCTINLYNAKPISKIEVYEFQLKSGEGMDLESVKYDRAIRFEQEGGKPFCVACQLDGPGIATEVHFSEDEATVREFLEGSQLRVCLA